MKLLKYGFYQKPCKLTVGVAFFKRFSFVSSVFCLFSGLRYYTVNSLKYSLLFNVLSSKLSTCSSSQVDVGSLSFAALISLCDIYAGDLVTKKGHDSVNQWVFINLDTAFKTSGRPGGRFMNLNYFCLFC